MFKNDKLQAVILIALIAIQVAGVFALLHHFQLFYLAIMIPIYAWGCFSTTLYLHRYLTHRGMEMPEWLKFFWAMGSAVCLSGDPVTWVGDHRYHHLKSDTDEDIHSPLHGFPYAHMMWLVRKPESFRLRSLRYASDVRKIWYCKILETPMFYVVPHILVALTLYFTLGGAGLLWCLYFPMLVLYNFTWAVNSICHMPSLGYRTHETTDASRNNFWVGLGSFGEGFHNNHHAKPKCAAHGLQWWEIDATKYLIWTLEKLGLAWQVAWPKTETAESETEVVSIPTQATALLAKVMEPGQKLASE
ncbi:MAG: acyl-CoA desaturase [Chthoniobacterales bacterium]